MFVKNWEKWQTYRKDRGTPPWIKVHRNIMSNIKWVSLSDAEKGQLVSMWIAAADNSGELPDDPAILKRMCMLDCKPNIIKFKELGLLTTSRSPGGNQAVTTCPQLVTPETETETKAETKAETETETKVICPLNIEMYLDDKLRESCKQDAPGLDFGGYIIPAYHKFMLNKPLPNNPIGSFRGFVKKCYKNHVAEHGVP